MMRAPGFWRADGAVPVLLSPLGALYGAIAEKRLRREAPRAALPTIVIGGLTAGGDGKTPLAIAVAEMLAARGERPAFLTRGYGRRRQARRTPPGLGAAPFAVDLARDDADSVGDEALLLARHAPAIVGADRIAGAEIARARGATALILDDGFHSRRLAPDLSLLVVDSDYGAGAGRCIPAGPLRAPLDAQIAAADALVVIGGGAAGRALARRCAKPAFKARMAPDEAAARRLAGARVVAFAGIGRPDKFFRTLRETGAEIVATRRFADHRRFSARDIAGLAALQRRARLTTTEKDAMRLSGSGLVFDVLPVRLLLPEMDAFAAMLSQALESARVSRAS